MTALSVQGRKLSYEAQPQVFDKSALAVVCIHGTGGDLNDWRHQLDGLSDDCTVISLSLPSHGDSEGPRESTVVAFSQCVSAFIEALELEQVIVVGCSLGSAITLWLALHPKPWLVGIGLVGAGGRLRVHPLLLDGVLVDKEKSLEMLTQYALAEHPNSTTHALVHKKLSQNDAQVIHDDLAACNAFDVMDRLGDISLPVTIVVGAEDKLTPVKYSQFLQKGISGSQLTVIPSAGHLVMMEQPREFNAALAEFVKRVTRR